MRSVSLVYRAGVAFWLAIAHALGAPEARAICLNPFGCEPKTQAECVRQAQSARTEAAAKASIAQCMRLPLHTESQCREVETLWAAHMKASDGVEWHWSDRASKQDCRKHYPVTFTPAVWVTPGYCGRSAARLSRVLDEVNPTTGKSLRLEKVRREMPDLLEGLDDWHAIAVLQRVYYPGRLPEEVAATVFVDAPPDPLTVEAECRRLNALAVK